MRWLATGREARSGPDTALGWTARQPGVAARCHERGELSGGKLHPRVHGAGRGHLKQLCGNGRGRGGCVRSGTDQGLGTTTLTRARPNRSRPGTAHQEACSVYVEVHVEDVYGDNDGTRLHVDPPVVLCTSTRARCRGLREDEAWCGPGPAVLPPTLSRWTFSSHPWRLSSRRRM